MTNPELKFVLHKTPDGKFEMWACRGEGKGCARNKYRKQQKPCEDCYGPCDDNMTLGEVAERIRSGN